MAPESSAPPVPETAPPFAPVPEPAFPYAYWPPARRRFQDRIWKHVILFLFTLLTTTFVGTSYYLNFASDFGRHAIPVRSALFLHGFWYSIPVLLILGAHEMGHYLLCRRYNVDASLPFFIPLPLMPTGTLGAVIKIREMFPTRTILFDIGVAGPIAGFVMLVPVLFWGVALSHVVPDPHIQQGLEFGEPLLFRAVAWLIFGPLPAGHVLNAHPMVFAAWFGMLATALNLLPFGQMDGGHLTHATLQRHSTIISTATVLGAAVMCFFSRSWLATTIVMVVMLFVVGPRHPRVLDENEPLAPGRIAIAVFAVVMLILCFTPIPLDVLGGR